MSPASKSRPEDLAKAERLAAALRENLRRRKAQARAQQDTRQGAANQAAHKTETDKSPSR